MFKHILIPTDGSELSHKAIQGGIELAKAIKAKVTGFYATPEYSPAVYEDSFPIYSMSREEFLGASKTRAESYLAVIETLAKEAGVGYQGAWSTSDHPAEAIIRAAENNGCDLIYMASHGRKGIQALLLGSETQKVLTHCKIPVLVHR
jgi:nucleotide-binding universal stress UspA family protein